MNDSIAKKVALDTNLLLDIILMRDGFQLVSAVCELAKRKMLHLYISQHSLATVWYIATQKLKLPDKDVFNSLTRINSLCKIFLINNDVVEMAINNPNPDFEDSLLLYAAKHEEVDCVLSNDKKMQKSSVVDVVSPQSFMRGLKR